MTVFVSYARKDNPVDSLRSIEAIVSGLGTVYIDDVHGAEAHDRLAAVETALEHASVLVGVATPHYLHTAWTRREFTHALRRHIPIFALMPDGLLVSQDEAAWPWHEEAVGSPHTSSVDNSL